jgi:hypothetical protein
MRLRFRKHRQFVNPSETPPAKPYTSFRRLYCSKHIIVYSSARARLQRHFEPHPNYGVPNLLAATGTALCNIAASRTPGFSDKLQQMTEDA